MRRARAYLEGEEDDVCLALQPDDRAALLHRLHRVLDLVEPPLRAPRRNVVVVLVAELRHADERRVQGQNNSEQQRGAIASNSEGRQRAKRAGLDSERNGWFRQRA